MRIRLLEEYLESELDDRIYGSLMESFALGKPCAKIAVNRGFDGTVDDYVVEAVLDSPDIDELTEYLESHPTPKAREVLSRIKYKQSKAQISPRNSF